MEFILHNMHITPALIETRKLALICYFYCQRGKDMLCCVVSRQCLLSLMPIISVYDIHPFKWGYSLLKGLLTDLLIFKRFFICEVKASFTSTFLQTLQVKLKIVLLLNECYSVKFFPFFCQLLIFRIADCNINIHNTEKIDHPLKLDVWVCLFLVMHCKASSESILSTCVCSQRVGALR